MESLPNEIYNLIKCFKQTQEVVDQIRKSDVLLKEGYFNIQGKFICKGENGFIYRILSPHSFYKLMATYQVATDIGLTCFLPQQLIITIPDFMVTKQKEVKQITMMEIRELVSDLDIVPDQEFYKRKRRSGEQRPRRMDIEKLFLKFYPEEYKKLCDFLSFFQIEDIEIHNIGMLNGKPFIFDYELYKKATIEELKNFYKQYNIEFKINYGMMALT